MADRWDVIIAGGGTVGLPAAIFAARRGARVLVLEAAAEIGGTLHISTGQMSAAGTKLQASLGIEDSPDRHFVDVLRISKGTADEALVRLAVDNAAETYDWLAESGFEPLDGHPVFGLAHEPYSQRRYYWGRDGGRSILNVMRSQFEAALEAGNVSVYTDCHVTALVQGADGRVTGVIARGPGGEVQYDGRNVVLATGGYASNPALFEQLNGHPQYVDAAYDYARGAGIDLGTSAGGFLRGAENYLCSFGSILEDDNFPAAVSCRARTMPHDRPPWEIYVNVRGERFVAEDNPSVDAREHALLEQPGLRYWIVYDDAIAQAAPPLIMVGMSHEARQWSADEVAEAFATHPMFARADSLGELAQMTGIDGAGLALSVAVYNAGLSGADPLGREHRPLPLTQAPYYAVRVQGTSISSTVGLAVDGDLAVIGKDRKPIPGLYAAGELLGSGQTMGSASVGGMMVTPALTFGRLLGTRILDWSDAAQAAE